MSTIRSLSSFQRQPKGMSGLPIALDRGWPYMSYAVRTLPKEQSPEGDAAGNRLPLHLDAASESETSDSGHVRLVETRRDASGLDNTDNRNQIGHFALACSGYRAVGTSVGFFQVMAYQMMKSVHAISIVPKKM